MMENPIMIFAIPILVAMLYLAPWLIAMVRNTENRSWVALLNILFGWTIVIWLVAFIMATEGRNKS